MTINSVRFILEALFMNKKMTLTELMKLVNKEIEKKSYLYASTTLDKRTSLLFTERRIRDLISKSIVPKPIKEGVHSFYSVIHFNALLEYKVSQAQGQTEKSFKLQKNSTLSQSSGLDKVISDIENRTASTKMNFMAASNIFDSDEKKAVIIGSPARSVLYSVNKNENDIPVIDNKNYKISENIELNISNDVSEDEIDNLLYSIEKIVKLYK